MAFSIAQFPAFPSTVVSRRITVAKPTLLFSKNTTIFPQLASRPRDFTCIRKASPDEERNAAEESSNGAKFESDEMTELGKEIKQAMKAREEEKEKEPSFVSGVVEEIKEIEWPAFNKVLGTTGVVLGVIAGSSVVLLTVNAVLAEISDRVFAGRGVQDFFG